jgi:hypothetical protein
MTNFDFLVNLYGRARVSPTATQGTHAIPVLSHQLGVGGWYTLAQYWYRSTDYYQENIYKLSKRGKIREFNSKLTIVNTKDSLRTIVQNFRPIPIYCRVPRCGAIYNKVAIRYVQYLVVCIVQFRGGGLQRPR